MRWPMRLVCGAAVVAVGCSAGNSGDNEFGSGGSGGGAAASGGSGNTGGGFSGSGGSSGSGTGGGFGANGGSGNTGGGSQGCATAEGSAQATPAVINMVVDTSGSMADPPSPGAGQTKWMITRNAIKSALGGMPQTNAVGFYSYPYTSSLDVIGGCIKKIQTVPIAFLTPAQAQAIGQSMDTIAAVGGTPTHDAYVFGLQQLVNSPIQGNKFVLLITDGAPTYALNCNGTGQDPVDNTALVNQVASAAGAGVRTFVVGSPGSETARESLSQMATAGGTAQAGCSDSGPNYCHFDMTTATDFGQALASALADISGQTLSCTYDIPDPGAGQTIDKTKVNVEYTPPGGSPETIGKDSSGNCGDGWDYSTDGSQIILCGATCDRVKAEGGDVKVIFGCETIVQ